MEKLIEYIKNNENKVIAIDGPSGAGKSTIASYLENNYDCLVFHTDDYFLPGVRKTKERLNTPGGNLDFERMEEEIFENLEEDYIVSNRYNCQTENLEVRNAYKKRRNIIIEGVYSLHPNFRKYYDLTTFIDIERDEQYKRILERSGAKMLERFKSEWIPLEDKYFEDLKVRNDVSLFIKNSYINHG